MKTSQALAVAPLVLLSSTLLSGCPGNSLEPYLGVWYFNDSFSAGDFGWELLANGNVVQLDDVADDIPGEFTWELLTDSAIVFYQHDGVNRSVLTGAFLTNESISGVSIQTNGPATGTTGSWSLVRNII